MNFTKYPWTAFQLCTKILFFLQHIKFETITTLSTHPKENRSHHRLTENRDTVHQSQSHVVPHEAASKRVAISQLNF